MQKHTRIIIFQLWAVIGLIVFSLMLLHKSTPAVFFGRYSTSFALSLAIVAASVVLAVAGGWLAAQDRMILPRSRGLAWMSVFLCLSFIVLFWLFAPGAAFLPAIALFRVYAVLVAAGLTLFYLIETQAVQAALPAQTWVVLLSLGVLLAIGLTVSYIGRVPESRYFDEPLVANYGWTCATRGAMGVEMWPPRDNVYIATLVPIAYCMPGLLMKWFGTTLTIARIFGIVTIWLAAPFVFLTAKRLYGMAEAVIATLVMILFALSHNFLRSDPYVTFVVAFTLWATIRTKDKPSLLLHFASGFVLATVIEGHQLGIRFIPIFGLLYIWQYIMTIREQQRWVWYAPFFAFVLGGVSYVPVYYLVHVVWWGQTNLFDLLDLLQAGYDEQLAVGGDVNTTQRIWNNFVNWFLLYGMRHPAEVILIIIGLITAIWQRTTSDRLLLYLFGMSFVTYILITPKPTDYYWVHHLPLVAILAAGFLYRLRSETNRIQLTVIFPVLVVMVLQSAHYFHAAQNQQNADRVMAISFDINEHLPDEIQRITGHQVYFYGLAQRDFFDSNTYAKISVEEANAEYTIGTPQAVIRTAGLDEHPAIVNYMTSQSMVAVRCYSTFFFGQQTTLYVLPEFADDIEPQSCSQ